MAKIIIDGRGKKMVAGGRRGAAKQARFLRGIGMGNAAARRYIETAAAQYVKEYRLVPA